ncbi:hypothetical protein VE25_10080 [Devosia geojensis]|uniref:Uncharacterized protein n=1 Tax=Devosia geojensis TaxID=443610 RepID=A0A0F5FUV5_9HYPH|nr:hypothetical protein [Devosia geojensis]KKB11977.1 hypothetical protein VE25_10080 [Devosia geojensis]
MPAMQEILLLVGRLNYVWTNTESLFIYLISHLMGTSKEAAIVVFLTLNTTRARLDLIERLAKLPGTDPADRAQIEAFAKRLGREGKLRNKYNHCIYSFDETGERAFTQLMRISDVSDDIRYGKIEVLDEAEMERINATISAVTAVNRDIWGFLNAHGIKA